MADPFTLISLGLGAAGSLASGIYNAATADDRKKEWLAEQQRIAQLEAIEASRMPDTFSRRGIDFWGDGAFNAKLKKQAVQKEAEERFKVDPMTFLPFVQQGTQLAGGIYDAATERPRGVGTVVGPTSGVRMSMSDFLSPEELEYYQRGQRG